MRNRRRYETVIEFTTMEMVAICLSCFTLGATVMSTIITIWGRR